MSLLTGKPKEEGMTLEKLGKQRVSDEFTVYDLQSMCTFSMEDPYALEQELLDDYLVRNAALCKAPGNCVVIRSPLSERPEFTKLPNDDIKRSLIARTWHARTKDLCGRYIIAMKIEPAAALKDFFNGEMADDNKAAFVSLFIYYSFAQRLLPYGFEPCLCVLHRECFDKNSEAEPAHLHYVLVSDMDTRSVTYKSFMREWGDCFAIG